MYQAPVDAAAAAADDGDAEGVFERDVGLPICVVIASSAASCLSNWRCSSRCRLDAASVLWWSNALYVLRVVPASEPLIDTQRLQRAAVGFTAAAAAAMSAMFSYNT